MDFIFPQNWQVKITDQNLSFTERLRKARQFKSKQWQNWLEPKFDNIFLDPYLLPDMKIAVKRLIAALSRQEKIGIYGDYDADGIPGTALLLSGLNKAGYQNLCSVIPTREEGYGLRLERLRELAEQGVSLIITVDTGITAQAEVKEANEWGLEFIVTDHHEPVGELPPALAVIDPKRSDSKYKNRDLVGTAVAYKLLWALYDELGLSKATLKWLADLVAIATVADLMPLNEENRGLVLFGLKTLRQTKNVGLSALMRVAGLSVDKIDTGHISFAIAPRLNAPSRLARERHELAGQVVDNLALTLLTTKNDSQALEAASLINQLNLHRQSLIQNLVDEALAQSAVPEGGAAYYLPNAPVGLVGLVASRLSDTSGWPTLVMGKINGSVRGSGRSPTSLSLLNLLVANQSWLTQFGGHAQAGGFSLLEKNVAKFIKSVNKFLKEEAVKHPRHKNLAVDTWLASTEAVLDNALLVEKLAPFGMGNPKPKFAFCATIKNIRLLGKNQEHAKVQFSEPYPDAIWFNTPTNKPAANSKVAVVANLEVNNYWQPAPQLAIVDLQQYE